MCRTGGMLPEALCRCRAHVLSVRVNQVTRGETCRRRDPGLRNPRTSNPEDHEPHKRKELALTLSIRGFLAGSSGKRDLAASSLTWARRAEGAARLLAPRKSRHFFSPQVLARSPRPLGKRFLRRNEEPGFGGAGTGLRPISPVRTAASTSEKSQRGENRCNFYPRRTDHTQEEHRPAGADSVH